MCDGKITLWDMLTDQKIVIPIIQRDYAQGRVGEENRREKFLYDIKKALDDNRSLNLDFIFGTQTQRNNGERVFLPLDGQQRLTTLWLLHWYLAFMSGFEESEAAILNEFYYETRTSSTDFCHALCEKASYKKYEEYKKKAGSDDVTVADYIRDQTWFFSRWLLDPTITAMLRMLSGDREAGRKDNIDSLFHQEIAKERVYIFRPDGTSISNVMKSYYGKAKKLLSFNRIVMGEGERELPVPDDQYIKMNSRGLGLTDFESFKANLTAWLRVKADQKEVTNDEINKLVANIDNTWTDVIWRHKKDVNLEAFDHNIDEELFAFIKRYMINSMAIAKTGQGNYIEGKAGNYEANKIQSLRDKTESDEDNNPGQIAAEREKVSILNTFDMLMDDKKDDDRELFDKLYAPSLTVDILRDMNYIFHNLNTESNPDLYRLVIDRLNELKVDEKRSSWLLSKEYGNIEDQVYFYVITRLLKSNEIGKGMETDFVKSFLRVARNLIENSDTGRSRENMIRVIRKLEELFEKTIDNKNWNLYSCLASMEIKEDSGIEKSDTKKSALDQIWQEEIEKAKAIVDSSKKDITEAVLEEAENYSFFKGMISFLYRGKEDANGYSEDIDWGEFIKNKWPNSKKLFDASPNVSTDTMRKYLGMFEKFDDLIVVAKSGGKKVEKPFCFTTIGDHGKRMCWKSQILKNNGENKEWRCRLHRLLMDPYSWKSVKKQECYRIFLETPNLLEKILEKDSDSFYLDIEKNERIGIYKSGRGRSNDYIAIVRGGGNNIAGDFESSNSDSMKFIELLNEGKIINEDLTQFCYIDPDTGKKYVFLWGRRIYYYVPNDDKRYGWDIDGLIYEVSDKRYSKEGQGRSADTVWKALG